MPTLGGMRAFSLHEMWSPDLPPWEVALRALLVYLFLLLLLRLSGRKEVTRYSVFDVAVLFLVAVAARTSILADDTSLTSSFVALATIVGTNWVLSWASFRSHRLATFLEGRREVLLERGEPRWEKLREARISEDELRARLRQHGTDDFAEVERAYLEHNGQVTFVLRR